MAITLNLQPEVEERLRAEAERRGVTIEDYIVENTCLSADFCHRRTEPFHVDPDEKVREVQRRARIGK